VLQEVRRFDEAIAAHREAAAICWTSVILRNPPLPEQDPEAVLKIIQIPIFALRTRSHSNTRTGHF
jgi:hypothetical protein